MLKIDKSDIKRLSKAIDDASKVVITAHMSPDGDAVGSSLALASVMAVLGKDTKVVVPDDASKQLAFLPGFREMVVYCKYVDFATELINDADLIFCLDYNGLGRIDRMAPAVSDAKATKVMIDHHLYPQDFCDITISAHHMSSTCSVLYYVLCTLDLFDAIERDAATCLLAGMMTDTGNFSYNANDPDLYRVVAQLVTKGANRDKLSDLLFNVFSESCLRLNGYALAEKMEVWKDYGAALITLSREELNRFHYAKGDTEGLVNKPLAIPGVHYSAFLREEESYIKVSMRSQGDFPCDVVCHDYFNGGGHKNAAGGEFNGTLDECAQLFRSLLKENKKKYLK